MSILHWFKRRTTTNTVQGLGILGLSSQETTRPILPSQHPELELLQRRINDVQMEIAQVALGWETESRDKKLAILKAQQELLTVKQRSLRQRLAQ
ncbi:MAG TPA: hypothetical protein VFD58_24250 [Blastocatellia bacterium]|nr:hypothetical protein [Blastocatellia bacterium]